MAAYIVFIREGIRNQAELDIYTQKAPASMAGHALTPLAAYGRCEVLEGPTTVDGVVILQFPSYDEAKAWYNSPAYTEARQHRFKGANFRAVIVEGL